MEKNKEFNFIISKNEILEKLHLAAVENVEKKLPSVIKHKSKLSIINTRFIDKKVNNSQEDFQLGIFYTFEQKDAELKDKYSDKNNIPKTFLSNEFLELFRHYFEKFSGSANSKNITESSLTFNRIPTNTYNNPSTIKTIVKDFSFMEMEDKDKEDDNKKNDKEGNYVITLGYIVAYKILSGDK